MNRNTVILVITALAAAFYLIFGIWPLLDARGFFDGVATFEPYNPHFLHDIGAFQVGIGATLAAALWKRHDAIFAALAGAGIGTAVHAGAHLSDKELGGQDSDVVVFALVALLLLGTALWRLMSARKMAA